MRASEDSLREGFEFVNDMSETQIITLIKEKKIPAITLWLRSHHPQYGSRIHSYKSRPSAEDLTPEETIIITEALALVSGVSTSKKHGRRNNRRTDPQSMG